MNWRRGLFRIWLALSVFWAVFASIEFFRHEPMHGNDQRWIDATPENTACMKKHNFDKYFCLMDTGSAPHLETVDRPLSFSEIAMLALRWLLAACSAPVAILVIWFSGLWIARGFNAPPSN